MEHAEMLMLGPSYDTKISSFSNSRYSDLQFCAVIGRTKNWCFYIKRRSESICVIPNLQMTSEEYTIDPLFEDLFWIETHRHIQSFLQLKNEGNSGLNNQQIVSDGSELSSIRITSGLQSINHPLLVNDSPESIGMLIDIGQQSNNPIDDFSLSRTGSILREVVELIGRKTQIRVIEVKTQSEVAANWTFGRQLVDYFDDKDRKSFVCGWMQRLKQVETNLKNKEQFTLTNNNNQLLQ
jgi:hypothetical protein